MKVLNVSQIREGDAFTIAHEPISSIDLMERAASVCVDWILENYNINKPVSIFAGVGNNGGDALVIARLLSICSYQVSLYVVEYSSNYSPDFKINLERLKNSAINIHFLREDDHKFELLPNSFVIDGIFGSGLSRGITGFVANIIHQINQSRLEVISIDIASGLMADKLNSDKNVSAIYPKHTLSLAFPKMAFFYPENEAMVGQWHLLDIGIHPEFIQNVKQQAYLTEAIDVQLMIKIRSKFAHKGQFGHALLIAGSSDKMGAAILASKAALRTGLGLLTSHIPKSGINIFPIAIPEAMLSLDIDEHSFSQLPDLTAYNAIAIGPGLGTLKASQLAMKLLVQEANMPLVIDADGINILSENKTWLAFLPQGSILTPHPKEFDRLAGNSKTSEERRIKQIELSQKHGLYIVLKGANTSISCPDGQIFINSTGNPGMATAGSGDVLTGMILSLMAQNYSPKESCILGVYLHGLAGDIAAMKLGFESMIASDIVDHISQAYIHLL